MPEQYIALTITQSYLSNEIYCKHATVSATSFGYLLTIAVFSVSGLTENDFWFHLSIHIQLQLPALLS